jgi:hypothetical protein
MGIKNYRNVQYILHKNIGYQLKAEQECLLVSVYFCRNREGALNKILLKDLCDDSYEIYSSKEHIHVDIRNRIGNWDTIQDFMKNVSLFFPSTYKFLSIYTQFVKIGINYIARTS